ncbi:hypothetical protein ACFLQV_04020, partial [Calditrichota bacterium]
REPWTEASQADYLIRRAEESLMRDWCAGMIVGVLADWEGQIPSISGPLRGQSLIYTNGLVNKDRRPKLAYNRFKAFLASGDVEPLPPGNPESSKGGLIVVVGIALLLLTFIAARQNNLFRFNLFRNFTSSRGFFQDIGDRRYFQTSQTILLAMLQAGGFALIGAAWLYSMRYNYRMDWLLGWILQDPDWIGWVGSLVWHPYRGLIFFWGFSFFLIWCAAFEIMLISVLLGRGSSLAQGLDFTTWTMSGYLFLIPLGLMAEKIFEANAGWVIAVILIGLTLWFMYRFIIVMTKYMRRGFGLVAVMLSAPPIITAIVVVAQLEYSRDLSLYWGFITQLSK